MREVVYVGDGLDGELIAAILAHVNRATGASLDLNPSLVTTYDRDRVLSWARREIARGVRVSWLLADELPDLA